MLTEQIIKFKLGGPGPLGRYMYSYNWFFSWQNKISYGKSSNGCYLLLKYCRRGNVSYFRLPGLITYKIKQFARF